MASVHERPDRGGQQQVKWRDPDTGKWRTKMFPANKKREAQRYGERMEVAKSDGTYVDPVLGKTTFKTYAEEWRKIQAQHREGTAKQIGANFENHVYPVIGNRSLSSLRKSTLQALVKALSKELAPATVEVIYAWVAAVLKAAVADRVIPTSPNVDVKLPTVTKAEVVPLDVEQVTELVESIAPRYRAVVILGAGTGMRISEVTGLTVDRVDFLKRRIRVDRQLTRAPGKAPTFGPLKDKENRPRTIPVGDVVLDALAAHLAEYGPGPKGLIFTTSIGTPVKHSTWSDVWDKARTAELDGVGYHALRHFYASTLIRGGRSVKEVQKRLGHSSASMTLDIYSHLWPEDEDGTRQVTDDALVKLSAGNSTAEGVQ